MGRPKKQTREPFWRASRDCWYVHVGTKTVKLSADKDKAWRLWHELMARPPEVRDAAPVGEPLAVEILDRFLDWCQKNRAAETYRWHKYFFQSLFDSLPANLPVSGLKPYHLTEVMVTQADWGINTKHNFVTAVNRAFNWAWKQEIIDRNPVAHAEKPAREARELTATPADFADVMAAIVESNFKELIRFAWESGVRPQEARAIEARHIDFVGNRIVFPPKESKGKKKHRVVYLTPEAAGILRPFAEARPIGPVFVNSEGGPWNKNSINCAFCRLRKKIGRKLHMGAFRKGYATEGLKSGVDVNTMAHLMGHTNGVMLAKVYARVQADPAFMAEAAIRAKKPRETRAVPY